LELIRADRALDWTFGVGRSTFDLPMAETSTAVIASANNLPSNTGLRSSSTARRLPSGRANTLGLSAATARANRPSPNRGGCGAKPIQANSHAGVNLVTGYMPQLSGLNDAATVHANILAAHSVFSTSSAELRTRPGRQPA